MAHIKTMSYADISAYTGIPLGHLRVMRQRGQLPPALHPIVPLWTAKDIQKWWAEYLAAEDAAAEAAAKESGEDAR